MERLIEKIQLLGDSIRAWGKPDLIELHPHLLQSFGKRLVESTLGIPCLGNSGVRDNRALVSYPDNVDRDPKRITWPTPTSREFDFK